MIKTATTTINMLHDLATVPAQGFVGDIVAEFPNYVGGAGEEGPLRMQWDALFTQVHDARYTIHHVSYIIYHTPYTIHHTPYTMNSYTMHDTRYTVHSYTHTLIHSYTHTLIHSYTHTLIHSYTHTLIHSYTRTLIHSYTLTMGCTVYTAVELQAVQLLSMERRRLCAPGRDIGCK
jgi:hypothetical protein